jgi:hypothetical protein
LIDGLPEPPVGPQRQEYSDRFKVRIPKSLHAALVREAEAEGVSLNQLVVAKPDAAAKASNQRLNGPGVIQQAHGPAVEIVERMGRKRDSVNYDLRIVYRPGYPVTAFLTAFETAVQSGP